MNRVATFNLQSQGVHSFARSPSIRQVGSHLRLEEIQSRKQLVTLHLCSGYFCHRMPRKQIIRMSPGPSLLGTIDGVFVSLSLPNSFYFLFMATPAAYGNSQLGIQSELQLLAYATACGSARYLTHWARPGIELTSSLRLCWVLNPLNHNGSSGCPPCHMLKPNPQEHYPLSWWFSKWGSLDQQHVRCCWKCKFLNPIRDLLIQTLRGQRVHFSKPTRCMLKLDKYFR